MIIDHRYKYSCNFIYQFLNWSFTSLSILHHLDDLGKHRITSYFFGFELKTSFLIDSTRKNLFVFYFSIQAQVHR